MKRITSLSMVLVLLFLLSFASFADTTVQNYAVDGQQIVVKVLVDDATQRIVQVTEGSETSISTYNKIDGSVTLSTNGKNVELDADTKNQLNKISSSEKDYLDSMDHFNEARGMMMARTSGTIIDQTKTDDHYYKVYQSWLPAEKDFEYRWDIGIKGTSAYNILQGNHNESQLNAFRSKVRDIQLQKIKIAGAFGAGVTSTIVACLAAAPETLGAGAVIALLVAAGATIGAAVLGFELYQMQCDADYMYRTIPR